MTSRENVFDGEIEGGRNVLQDFITNARGGENKPGGSSDDVFSSFTDEVGGKHGGGAIADRTQNDDFFQSSAGAVYSANDDFQWADGSAGMGPLDKVVNNRGPIMSNTRIAFADALVGLTQVQEDEKIRATTFKGRQNLDVSMRYHPLGLGGSANSDIWAFPKADYFVGIPEGAIISSNMEYVPQAAQIAALLHADASQSEPSAWLDDLYSSKQTENPSTSGMPALLDSVITPFSSTLTEMDDNVQRMVMYNMFDDREQETTISSQYL
jgi:hypothetical protein